MTAATVEGSLGALTGQIGIDPQDPIEGMLSAQMIAANAAALAVRGWAVCRMHGARGGAPKGEANGNYKTGEHTAEVREARRLVRAILRRAKEAMRLSEARAPPQCMGLTRVPSSRPTLSVKTGADSV
jgi:hypothetical protein